VEDDLAVEDYLAERRRPSRGRGSSGSPWDGLRRDGDRLALVDDLGRPDSAEQAVTLRFEGREARDLTAVVERFLGVFPALRPRVTEALALPSQ
jgi:hypothetical protein